MIPFIVITVSLIAMIIVAFYISNSERLTEHAKAVILVNYFVAIPFLLIMFVASLRDVLEV